MGRGGHKRNTFTSLREGQEKYVRRIMSHSSSAHPRSTWERDLSPQDLPFQLFLAYVPLFLGLLL